MSIADDLQATIEMMVQKGKGTLAPDDCQSTIARRLASIKVESTEWMCQNYIFDRNYSIYK